MRAGKIVALLGLAVLVGGAGFAAFGSVSYAPLPARSSLLNPGRLPVEAAWDVMGRSISVAEARRLEGTEDGRRMLSPAAGAIRIDHALIRTGRDAFYRETYGNEVFLTDILGLLDGGIDVWNVSLALAGLAGRGTADLRVRLGRDVQVGDRLYRRGEIISTGLDVPRGGLFPLGIKTFLNRGRIRMGITCALCHAAVDPASGKIVEGAPNPDLNVGLMMALASNPAAYLVHTGAASLSPYQTDPERNVAAANGARERLPDPGRLAADLRPMLAAWPPGSFDSSPDLVNNPTSIPSSFSRDAHPYGWSGHAGIGPFRGLSALNNNVHGLNSDTTAQFAAAQTLFGLDPELYLGTLLQDAPERSFRFDPRGGRKPSEALAAADPTRGNPGVNSYAVLPTYPRANYVTSDSLIASRPGEPVAYAINGMSAFQELLRPPPAAAEAGLVAAGRVVFERAGCGACHAGPALTNNRVLPVEEVGTEPTRARSFARSEPTVAKPQLFAADAPFPTLPGARLVDVPVPEEGQVKLAWAHGGNAGGYKVQSLVGLAWSAPYLHDGGVAVGPDPERRPGVGATLLSGIRPDPANSLQALLDRELRARVVAANAASPQARTAHVTGAGHAFWADEAAGFSGRDRQALVAYLLSIDRPGAGDAR